MTGLREKLEEIAALDYAKAAVNCAAYNAVQLAREALALLESEQGEQMCRDHEAMEKLREAGGSLHHWGESDGRWVWTVYSTIRTRQVVTDPADAILGDTEQ